MATWQRVWALLSLGVKTMVRKSWRITLARLQAIPPARRWAQVNGRNAISWSQKFRYDVWYVDNATWWRDIHIVWRTVGKVFAREGISSQGHVTMPEFMGTTSKDSVIDMTRFSKETG